jgi:hypothetical protein
LGKTCPATAGGCGVWGGSDVAGNASLTDVGIAVVPADSLTGVVTGVGVARGGVRVGSGVPTGVVTRVGVGVGVAVGSGVPTGVVTWVSVPTGVVSGVTSGVVSAVASGVGSGVASGVPTSPWAGSRSRPFVSVPVWLLASQPASSPGSVSTWSRRTQRD